MSRLRIVPIGLVAVLALGIGACTMQDPDVTEEEQVGADQRPEPEENGDNGGEGEDAGETYTFVAIDIDFEEAPTEIPAGDVTIELVNDGGILHNVVIDELGDEPVVEAEGGETATGTATLEPGEYNYHCDVPGHETQMVGSFTVS